MLNESFVFGVRVQIPAEVGTAVVLFVALLLSIAYAGLFYRNGEFTGTNTLRNGWPILACFAVPGLLIFAEGIMGLNGFQAPDDVPAHWVMAFPQTAVTVAAAWLAGILWKVRVLVVTRERPQ